MSAPLPTTFSARLTLAESAVRLCEQGRGLRQVAASLREEYDLRIGHTSVDRLVKAYRAYEASGDPCDLLPDYRGCGRKPRFELDGTEAEALRGLVLVRGSKALAIESLPAHPACRPPTRRAILAEMDAARAEARMPRWPLSLRRAAHVMPEEAASFRGPKHFTDFEAKERRGDFLVVDGQRIPFAPNTIWESDDMSLNEPFRVVDPETGVVSTKRQVLFSQDTFSLHWMGASPLGRERDAYRAEDIADHVRHVVQTHGLPLLWRFERGPWENSFIDGIKQADGSTWGGLGALCAVQHVEKSRQKGSIEGSFNLLQNFLAHRSLHIGRERGEFEGATKAMLRARTAAGADDLARFWDIGQAADGIAEAMQAFHLRQKDRRALGRTATPDDLYADAQPRMCPPSEAWRLLPVKKEVTLRDWHVETTVPHYPGSFRFRVLGEASGDLLLESGTPLFIAFHPGRPEEGAHIFSRMLIGDHRNRDRIRFGEHLLHAPFSPLVPQAWLGHCEVDPELRKKRAAVRKEFRAVGRRAAAWSSEARDGRGNRTEMGTFAGPQESREGEESNREAGDSLLPAPSRVTSTRRAQPAPVSEAEEAAMLAKIAAAERELQELYGVPVH